METVVRNVRDLNQTDRAAVERGVGCQLRDTQQVSVNVVNLDLGPAAPESADQKGADDVPDWWKIYEGISDERVEELDSAIRQ